MELIVPDHYSHNYSKYQLFDELMRYLKNNVWPFVTNIHFYNLKSQQRCVKTFTLFFNNMLRIITILFLS